MTNFIDFYDEVTPMVDEGKALDDVHLIFSKAFSSISSNILTDKLMKCGQNIWTVRWIENWLHGCDRNTIFRLRLVTSEVPQRSKWANTI